MWLAPTTSPSPAFDFLNDTVEPWQLLHLDRTVFQAGLVFSDVGRVSMGILWVCSASIKRKKRARTPFDAPKAYTKDTSQHKKCLFRIITIIVHIHINHILIINHTLIFIPVVMMMDHGLDGIRWHQMAIGIRRPGKKSTETTERCCSSLAEIRNSGNKESAQSRAQIIAVIIVDTF